MAYALVLFSHTLDTGQYQATDYYLIGGTIYYIYQHGSMDGTTHVKVVTPGGQLIWQDDMVYDETSWFSVNTSGWYKCSTANTSVGVTTTHSDWQH